MGSWSKPEFLECLIHQFLEGKIYCQRYITLSWHKGFHFISHIRVYTYWWCVILHRIIGAKWGLLEREGYLSKTCISILEVGFPDQAWVTWGPQAVFEVTIAWKDIWIIINDQWKSMLQKTYTTATFVENAIFSILLRDFVRLGRTVTSFSRPLLQFPGDSSSSDIYH